MRRFEGQRIAAQRMRVGQRMRGDARTTKLSYNIPVCLRLGMEARHGA